jgi:C4-dicarboxylate-binding protein DctP
MLAPSLAKFGPLGVKEFEIFDLPYIFDSYAEVDKVMKGPIGAKLFTKLETKGIKALGFWENGFKNFSSNKPIRTPDNLRGMKIRIQSSKVLDEEMRTLGALPQVMAFSEVYQALQTGVVDGTELEPSNLYTSKAFEVQKHLTLTNHGFLGYAVIVNKTFWEGLPADIRATLTTAMNDSSVYANQIAKQETDKALAAIKASGKTTIYTPTAAERAAFRKALIPVHQKMSSRFGQDLLTEIYKETAFKPVE